MTLAGYNLQDNVYIYSNNKCMCVFLISPVPIAEPLTSELIDTPVFYNLAPRPIKYRVSVPIPNPETEMLDVEVTFAPVLRVKRDIHLVFLWTGLFCLHRCLQHQMNCCMCFMSKEWFSSVWTATGSREGAVWPGLCSPEPHRGRLLRFGVSGPA